MARAGVFISIVGDASSATKAFADAQGELNRLTSRTVRAGAAIQAAGKSIGNAGKTLTRGLTLPVAGAALASVKLATNFQDSMSKIEGLVGVSKEQVAKWSSQILDMSRRLPQSPQELADAMYFITSAGISGAEALNVLNASARAAAAGLGKTEVVADAVTSVINAYGSSNITATRATDILTAAVREGKAEADSFAPALGRVIPLASNLGIEFDQVSAAMSAMTATGLDANEAATALRGFMATLIKPSQKGVESLKKLGISITEASAGAAVMEAKLKGTGLSMAKLRDIADKKGLWTALTRLKGAIGNDKEALAAIIPNVRALTGFLSLTGANAKDNAVIFGKLARATGDTDKAFKVASETAKFKFASAMSSLQASGIVIGNALLPSILKIVGAVARAADAFGKLGKGTQENIIKAALAFAAIGPGLRILGLLTGGVGKFVSAIGAFHKATGAIKSVSAALRALGLNPIGLVIVAVVALGIWLVHLWKTSKTFRSVVTTAFEAVAEVVGNVVGFAIQAFRFMAMAFLGTAGKIIHAAAIAFGWVPGLGPKLKAADKAFDDFKDSFLDTLEDAANKAYGWGQSASVQFASGIRSRLSEVKRDAQKAGLTVAQYLKLASPAEKGPLSERGGPEGWGQRFSELYSRGMARGAGSLRAGALTAVPAAAGVVAAPAAAGGGSVVVNMNMTLNGRPSEDARREAAKLVDELTERVAARIGGKAHRRGRTN